MNRHGGKVEVSSTAYKIVFLDMNGTLYQTENDVIQESSLQAIQALRDQSYVVCVATGRPLNQMNLILGRIQLDCMMMTNGGYVLDREQRLPFENPLDRQMTQGIVDWYEQQENGLMFHFGDTSYIYDKFYSFYYFCQDHHVLNYLFYGEQRSCHKRHNAYNAVLMTKEQRSLEEFLAKHSLLRSDLIEVAQGHFCFNIFNANSDKFVGINQVLQKEGISWEECICFGDSTNDVKMLEMAGVRVAMGNATDYVKSFANMVTASVYDHGAAHTLQKILDSQLELQHTFNRQIQHMKRRHPSAVIMLCCQGY